MHVLVSKIFMLAQRFLQYFLNESTLSINAKYVETQPLGQRSDYDALYLIKPSFQIKLKQPIQSRVFIATIKNPMRLQIVVSKIFR